MELSKENEKENISIADAARTDSSTVEIDEDKEAITAEDDVEASVVDDLLGQLAGSGKSKGNLLNQFLADLFKSKKEIRTVDSAKDSNGALVFNIEMIMLNDDGNPQVVVPARIKIAQAGDSKIDFFMQLPEKDYMSTKKLEDVDTSEFKEMDNSKKAVERACWKCFENSGKNDEEFLKQFIIDEDRFDFYDSEDGSYTRDLSCIKVMDDGEEVEIKFKLKVTPTNAAKEFVNLGFVYPDPNNLEGKQLVANPKYKNVDNKDAEIIEYCKKFTKEVYDVDTLEQMPDTLVASQDIAPDAKMLKATFKKIKSSKGYDIQMTNIFANYQPAEVLIDLAALKDDGEFVDSLPIGEPASYSILPTDDCLEISELPIEDQADYYEECTVNSYETVLKAAYKLYFDLEYSNFTAAGAEMMNIINLAENFNWRVRELIGTVSKMIIEDNLVLKHPVDLIHEIDICCQSQETKWDSFISIIRYDVECLVSSMLLYKNNISPAKKEQFNTYIRSWEYELNYTLNQAQK